MLQQAEVNPLYFLPFKQDTYSNYIISITYNTIRATSSPTLFDWINQDEDVILMRLAAIGKNLHCAPERQR